MSTVQLDASDAADLAETLAFLSRWLAGPDRDQLAASFTRRIGIDRGYDLTELRTDLDRFTFLLGYDERPTSTAASQITAEPPRPGASRMTHPAIPDRDERAMLNAALAATGTETGFWDETGQPAPWPDDIDEWTPVTDDPTAHDPRQEPF